MNDKIQANVNIEIPERLLKDIRKEVIKGTFIDERKLRVEFVNKVLNELDKEDGLELIGSKLKKEIKQSIKDLVSNELDKLFSHVGVLYERVNSLDKKLDRWGKHK